MTDREVCALAIKTFGVEHQLGILQEECAEVVVAVSHLRRGRITVKEVLSECADVEIMILQAREIYGDDIVDQIKAEKINYLQMKIKEKGNE